MVQSTKMTSGTMKGRNFWDLWLRFNACSTVTLEGTSNVRLWLKRLLSKLWKRLVFEMSYLLYGFFSLSTVSRKLPPPEQDGRTVSSVVWFLEFERFIFTSIYCCSLQTEARLLVAWISKLSVSIFLQRFLVDWSSFKFTIVDCSANEETENAWRFQHIL